MPTSCYGPTRTGCTRLTTSSRGLQCDPHTVMGYWDGHWYDWYRSPLPREARRLCSRSGVVFLQANGALVRSLQRSGCPDVRYVAATSDERFQSRPERQHYVFNLVLVGNKITSRPRLKGFPGNVVRRRLVAHFECGLGRRFAVFAEGWTGPSAQGPLRFDEQARTYGTALAAVGCNNWLHSRYCFSNRLPISMSSARPVIDYKRGGVTTKSLAATRACTGSVISRRPGASFASSWTITRERKRLRNAPRNWRASGPDLSRRRLYGPGPGFAGRRSRARRYVCDSPTLDPQGE